MNFPIASRVLLVVDASVLIALGFMKVRDRLMLNERLDCYITQKSMLEVEKYYDGNANPENLEEFLSGIREHFTVIPDSELEQFSEEAQVRISHCDPKDWQEVALALQLKCAILTLDSDFLGAGIPTWTLVSLENYLYFVDRQEGI